MARFRRRGAARVATVLTTLGVAFAGLTGASGAGVAGRVSRPTPHDAAHESATVEPGNALRSRPAAAPAGPLAGRRPFPQHVRYPRQALRPKGVTAAQMDRQVLRFWRAWKVAYLRSTGSPGFWVKHDDAPSTVSEAIGYGMIFAAFFGDQSLFDGLFRHFRAHPSRVSPNLMAWKQVLVDGRMADVEGADSATDGDMDIAYGLLLAHRQWGSHGGVDYRRQALAVSRAVLRHDVNHRLWNTTPGDWATGADRRHTRTSDFMPSHFTAFAAADPARRAGWRRVLRATQRIVRHQFRDGSRATGLMPDFMVRSRRGWVPVLGRYLESPHDGDFGWNACRTPWRLSLSHLLDGRKGLRHVLRAQARWFRRAHDGAPSRIRAGYYVRNGPNGRPFANYSDLAFTAPAAVVAMLGGERGQRWMDRMWRAITSGRTVTSYYADSLRLMALLVVSRNWWQPRVQGVARGRARWGT